MTRFGGYPRLKRVVRGLFNGTPKPALPNKFAIPANTVVKDKRPLCVAAIIKDEGPYLREWLEFHSLVGIEHFYLYDNGSRDGTAAILTPYAAEGIVTLLPWIGFHADIDQQRLAYAHAIANFGPQWRWMAFIDADEFLFPVRHRNLPEALEQFADVGAVAVPWTMFGFSGHEHRPDGLVVESYTMRAAPLVAAEERLRLLNFKSIVRPEQVSGVYNVHFFMLKTGDVGAFDENKRFLHESNAKVEYMSRYAGNGVPMDGVFRLNHYFTRSKAEFERKIARGGQAKIRKDFAGGRRKIADSIEAATVSDNAILRFVPELRERLRSRRPGRLNQG